MKLKPEFEEIYVETPALGIYKNDEVLLLLSQILLKEDVVLTSLKVGKTDSGDLSCHPAFAEQYGLYFFPADYALPNGGISRLLSKIPENADIIFIASQSDGIININECIPKTDRVDFYGFIDAGRLHSSEYSNFLRGIMNNLVNINPSQILMFTPRGYENIEQRIRSRFLREGKGPEIHKVNSLEDVVKKIKKHQFDRVYLPCSFQPSVKDVIHHSLQKPAPPIFLFSPYNEMFLFENILVKSEGHYFAGTGKTI